jgi:hypothetical protein
MSARRAGDMKREQGMTFTHHRVRVLALLALTAVLSGCLGSGGGSSGGTVEPPPTGGGSGGGSTPVPPANRAPTISGAPVTAAKTLQPYVFQPTATDPDGDAVTFSIENQPAWAAFDQKSGKLSGTPSSAYTGKFSGIRISVSDGKSSSALPVFEINVEPTAPVTGSATLRWVPPTENVDGSPLTNLAGYVIRYGNSLSALGQELRVTSPAITSAVIEDLGTGTWYFTVSAYTTTGTESTASNAGSKTIA